LQQPQKIAAADDFFAVAGSELCEILRLIIFKCPDTGDKIMKRMVSCVVAVSALFAAASLNAANAADMAVKAPLPPPAAALAGWTGCYIGGNGGAGFSQLSMTDVATGNNFGSQSHTAAIGGGQAGCDVQWGPWVLGAKGQFDWGNINGQNVIPAATAFYTVNSARNIDTATGRIGYLYTPSELFYLQGGAAWTHDNTSIYGFGPPPFLSETASASRLGWVAGAGVEWMFAPCWSVFGEYNYVGLGTKNATFVLAPGILGTPNTVAIKQNEQLALVGINYHFNLGTLSAAR
jgi:outer membrane immunogenic protein